MQAYRQLSGAFRRQENLDHLFERHACAVVDFTFRRAELQKFRVDQASGIDDAAGLLQQTRTAHRDEIGSAAPGSDKVNHRLPSASSGPTKMVVK